jgi:WD40 repeat protein
MMHVTTFNSRRGLTELEFFPDGKTLAVGFTDHIVELWHVDRDNERFTIEGAVDLQ